MRKGEEQKAKPEQAKPKSASVPRTTSARKMEARKRHVRQAARKQRHLGAYIARKCELYGVPNPVRARTLGRARKCLSRMIAKRLNTESYQNRLRRRAERREVAESRLQSQAVKQAYLGPSEHGEDLIADGAS